MVLLVCFALWGNHKTYRMVHPFVGHIKDIVSRLQLQFCCFELAWCLVQLNGFRALRKGGVACCNPKQHKYARHYFLHIDLIVWFSEHFQPAQVLPENR